MAETRIQLCGRVVVRIHGHRVDDHLPGRQGRIAFVYLALNRHRPVPRDELVDALWPEAADSDRVSPLLSKLRRAILLEGRSELRLVLSGYRLLMEALAAHGNGAEALVIFEDLRRRLRDDFGATPSPATQALHRSLLV